MSNFEAWSCVSLAIDSKEASDFFLDFFFVCFFQSNENKTFCMVGGKIESYEFSTEKEPLLKSPFW